jgi:hypothetical protein
MEKWRSSKIRDGDTFWASNADRQAAFSSIMHPFRTSCPPGRHFDVHFGQTPPVGLNGDPLNLRFLEASCLDVIVPEVLRIAIEVIMVREDLQDVNGGMTSDALSSALITAERYQSRLDSGFAGTVTAIRNILGKSTASIIRSQSLLSLPTDMQEAVKRDKINVGIP